MVHVSHPASRRVDVTQVRHRSSNCAFVEEAWRRRLARHCAGGPPPDAAPFDFAFEKEGEETALRAEILGQLKQYHPGKVDEEMEKRFAAAPTAS